MADISSLQDLRKLQQDITERLERQLKLVEESRAGSGEAALAAKAEAAERAHAAYVAAQRERDGVVKYWTDRVQRLRAEATRQADEVKALKKQLAEAEKKGGAPAPKNVK